MTWFSKDDLRFLATLCENRRFADELVRDNAVDGTVYCSAERRKAAMEAEYMKRLSEKLLSVADSNARRVEITI